MCYFITVAVPDRAAAHLVDRPPEGLTVMPIANPSVMAQLPRHSATHLVIHGEMCSCGLFREEPSSCEQEQTIERLRRKYKAKGWSRSRIDRAISQHVTDTGATEYGFDTRLLSFIANVAEEVGELWVMVHWYDGDIDTEELSLSQGSTLSVEEFRKTNPVRKSDTVYRITRV